MRAASPATELEADVIVTATGLNLLAARRAWTCSSTARKVDLAETVAYKGMMLSGVPNFAFAARLHERLLDPQVPTWSRSTSAGCSTTWTATGTRCARRSGPDPSLPTEPLIDLTVWLRRSARRDSLPKQGPSLPWRLHQNYFRDVRMLKRGPVDDSMTFARPAQLGRPEAEHSRRETLAA